MRDPTNRTRMLVRWTRESGESPGHGKNLLSRQEQEKDRIWKVAVFLKDCFHARQILRAMKIGHWKGCHGPERRLKQCVCARENPLHMNRSVRRPTNPETKNWQHSDSFLSAYLSIPLRSQEKPDTKAMVMTIIVFLIHKILFILTGRCQQVTPPAGTKGSIDTREGSKWINEK